MAARYSTSPGSSSSATRSEMTTLESYEVDGRKYTPETTVELNDGSFLRIKSIVLLENEDTVLRGWQYVRTSELGNLVPEECRWLNEVCCLVNLTPNQSKERVGMHEVLVKPSEVKRARTLFMTNNPYSVFNINHIIDTSGLSRGHVKHEGPLFCRLKYIRVDPRLICTGKHFYEQSIQNFALSECDDEQVFNGRGIQCKADPTFLRESWRGNTILGGEHLEGHSGIQRYTFGDAFCGAGGASCGARAAGVHNQWAFDSDENAVKTYRLNFPDAFVYWAQVQDFVALGSNEVKADILHASSVCKTYSSAHTVAGTKDDENSATLFSWNALISTGKPRVATMEQVMGLIQRFPDHFRAVVRDFLSFGYSVRWKAFDLREYGVPQKRCRIMLLAAGPGETLPPFPRPTHGPGLEPFASIGSVINTIPSTATNHSPRPGRGGAPYPMNGPLRSCITTSGEQSRNYHPHGRRRLTCREFAACQNFPHDFQFCGTAAQVLKQIGNAVPPMFAEAFFREVTESLRSQDEISGTTATRTI